MLEISGTREATIGRWLAGLAIVLAVAVAGLWSLSATAAFADEATNAADSASKTATAPVDSASKTAAGPADSAPKTATEPGGSTSKPAAGLADSAPKTATDPTDSASKAVAPAQKTASDPADDLPGRNQLPLRAKAASSNAITPATFTISGKKYLQGRSLKEGEFTFVIAAAGSCTIPAGSDLPRKLRSTSLSDAEKYELVAHGGLTYYPDATQPLPDPSVVTNEQDGTVAFAPLTFTGSTLGETATGRHIGRVFCYTVSEQAPRDQSGKLLEGVTKDAQGHYVYQGVTYDDTVKRIYLYAYEQVDADHNSSVAIVPLGDATFDGAPVRSQSGIGAGFRNVFNGAQFDGYDGSVYFEGQPISAGEFDFDVRQVAEDGTLLNDQQVTCGSADEGAGASVPVIEDQTFDKSGRFFFTVSQRAPEKAVADKVRIDDTSYVITVEVAQDAQQQLDAQVTHVRKKPADSTQWVDVDLAAQPSPVVWENTLVKDEPATPSGTEGSGTAGADKPGAGDTPGTSTQPSQPDQPAEPDQPAQPDQPDQPSQTDQPDQPTQPDQPQQPGSSGGGNEGTKPGNNGAAGSTGTDNAKPDDPAEAPTVVKPAPGSEGADDASAHEGTHDEETIGTFSGASEETTQVIQDKDKKTSEPSKAFAQTGDPLFVGIIVLIGVAVVSAVALIVAKRRKK